MKNARDYEMFKDVAKVLGEDEAEKQLQRVIDAGLMNEEEDDGLPNSIMTMFTWDCTPQGSIYWCGLKSIMELRNE